MISPISIFRLCFLSFFFLLGAFGDCWFFGCCFVVYRFVASSDDPLADRGIGRRWTQHAIVAARRPVCVIQDVLFADVAAFRYDWPTFSSWAMRLFDDWAPLTSAPAFDPYDGVCIRWSLRGVALEPPLADYPEITGRALFWLLAWWRRLYGPLVSWRSLVRLSKPPLRQVDHIWLDLAARLGPSLFEWEEPSVWLWDRNWPTHDVGVVAAECTCDGFN